MIRNNCYNHTETVGDFMQVSGSRGGGRLCELTQTAQAGKHACGGACVREGATGAKEWGA